jgi:ArsR family transcriptional regulator
VCELESILHLPQPLISRHLAYLRNASLVTDNRQGMRVQYAPIAEDAFGQVLQAFLERAFQSRPAFREDVDRWRANTNLEAPKIKLPKTRFNAATTGGQP